MATTHFARSETTLTTHNALAERLTDFTDGACLPEIAPRTLSGAAVVRLFPAPPTLTTFALELLGIRREEQVAASDGLMPFQDPAFTG